MPKIPSKTGFLPEKPVGLGENKRGAIFATDLVDHELLFGGRARQHHHAEVFDEFRCQRFQVSVDGDVGIQFRQTGACAIGAILAYV